MDKKQGVQQVMHQAQLNPAPSSPSVSSSPSHEFSFTISLETTTTMMGTPVKFPEKSTKKLSSFAIDLSPADEIFSHGHLLPLHHHLPVSPRSSINSLDSFTLPIHEISRNSNNISNNYSTSSTTTAANVDHQYNGSSDHHKNIDNEKGTRKLRLLFSFLGWRKSRETDEGESGKPKFDIREVAKRYMRLIKPYLAMMMKNRRRRNDQLHRRRRQPYSFSSFSGNLRRREEEFHREKCYSSAPSSMITSRTNSGLLMGSSGSGSVTPTKSDSTMEELQAAIQAAIAHCKNTTLASDHQINLP